MSTSSLDSSQAFRRQRHVVVVGGDLAGLRCVEELRRRSPFKGSNYFWSDQYGIRIQFAGVAEADEIVVVDGSTDRRKFLARYRRGDRLAGAMAMDSAKLLMFSKTLIERGGTWLNALPALDELKAPADADRAVSNGAAI